MASVSPQPQVVVITGGNTGVGLATVQAFLTPPHDQHYTIYLGSRSLSRAQDAVDSLKGDEVTGKTLSSGQSKLVAVEIDIDNEETVKALQKKLEGEEGKLDILINNAGVHYDFPLAAGKLTTRQAYERAFSTNVVSTHLFTESLVALLLKSSEKRIIFISSGISSLGDHSDQKIKINVSPPAGWPKEPYFNTTTYRTSKTALNMMALEWAKILKNDGVKIHIADPGLLATNLGGTDPEQMKKMGAAEPIVGGMFIRSLAEGKRDQDLGRLVSKDAVLPW